MFVVYLDDADCKYLCGLVFTSSLTSSFIHLGELMVVSLYDTNDEGSLFQVTCHALTRSIATWCRIIESDFVHGHVLEVSALSPKCFLLKNSPFHIGHRVFSFLILNPYEGT